MNKTLSFLSGVFWFIVYLPLNLYLWIKTFGSERVFVLNNKNSTYEILREKPKDIYSNISHSHTLSINGKDCFDANFDYFFVNRKKKFNGFTIETASFAYGMFDKFKSESVDYHRVAKIIDICTNSHGKKPLINEYFETFIVKVMNDKYIVNGVDPFNYNLVQYPCNPENQEIRYISTYYVLIVLSLLSLGSMYCVNIRKHCSEEFDRIFNRYWSSLLFSNSKDLTVDNLKCLNSCLRVIKRYKKNCIIEIIDKSLTERIFIIGD